MREIRRVYELILDEEKQTEEELHRILEDRKQLDTQLQVLRELPTRIAPIINDTSALEETIRDIGALAENVSQKIRDIDRIRERVNQAAQRVNDIIDMKNCIDGVQEAMKCEDYERAAAHINRYLNIDKSILEGTNSAQLLESAERELKRIVGIKLETAVKNDDVNNILRYCKLYIPLGMRLTAITRFSAYFCSQQQRDFELVLSELQKSRRTAVEKGGKERVSYAAVISQLLSRCQRRIHRHKFIENELGADTWLYCLYKLNELTETNCIDILEIFIKDWQLLETIRIVRDSEQQRSRPQQSSTILQPEYSFLLNRSSEKNPNHNDSSNDDNESGRDPREFSSLIDQIALISQSVEIYYKFLLILMQKAFEKLKRQENVTVRQSQSPQQLDSEMEELSKIEPSMKLRNSQLHMKLQEILAYYISVEQYFMSQSIKKAAKQNLQEATGDRMMSVFIDEVFFILKEAADRAKATYNVDTVCAIINLINHCLCDDFKTVVITNSQRTQFNTNKSIKQSIIMLNNIEQSIEYMTRLKRDIEIPAIKLFSTESSVPVANSNDVGGDVVPTVGTFSNSKIQKVMTCLEDLEETAKKFRSLLQANLELLASNISPKIRQLLEPFATLSINYLLTEEQLNHNQINDPFFQSTFITSLEQILAPFKEGLSATLWDSFQQVIARFVADTLEQHLFSKQFNQFGAEQFNRDLRIVTSYFSLNTKKGSKDKFSRLTQIAYLLNLEKPAEVLEVWGERSGQMTWRLSPAEVKKVLMLRVDFDKEEIKKLKL